jgi:hypothetical protein
MTPFQIFVMISARTSGLASEIAKMTSSVAVIVWDGQLKLAGSASSAKEKNHSIRARHRDPGGRDQ